MLTREWIIIFYNTTRSFQVVDYIHEDWSSLSITEAHIWEDMDRSFQTNCERVFDLLPFINKVQAKFYLG